MWAISQEVISLVVVWAHALDIQNVNCPASVRIRIRTVVTGRLFLYMCTELHKHESFAEAAYSEGWGSVCQASLSAVVGTG
jgi:hypothetical protein